MAIFVVGLLLAGANSQSAAYADKGGNVNGGGGGQHGGGSGSGGNANGNGGGNGNGNANGSGNGVAGANSNAGGNGQGNANGVGTASSTVAAASGGSLTAGSVTVSLPSGALAGLSGNVTVSVKPAGNVPVPGGPVRFSPNGTLADIAVMDAQGAQITTFPAPITLALNFNAADLAMAGGDPKQLSAAFVVDANTPTLENPLHFPVGTFVLASNVTVDAANGQVVVRTQTLGSVVAVVANPVSFVATLQPGTPLYSSFDPSASTVLSTKPQFKTLQLVEPQIGSRLLVIDPDTGNYAYVDAAWVGPSGPPSRVAPAGVTRGFRPFD